MSLTTLYIACAEYNTTTRRISDCTERTKFELNISGSTMHTLTFPAAIAYSKVTHLTVYQSAQSRKPLVCISLQASKELSPGDMLNVDMDDSMLAPYFPQQTKNNTSQPPQTRVKPHSQVMDELDKLLKQKP